MSFISAQTVRVQPRPKLVYIDKDRGAQIFVLASGGTYLTLANGTPTGCAPSS